MSKQMTARENEIELLMEIADKDLEDAPPAASSIEKRKQVSPSELLESPLLKDYILDEKDITIIALLLKKFLDEKDEMKAFDIIKAIEKDKKNVFLEIKRLARLKELGIVEVAGNRSDNTDGVGLLRSSVCLSDKFLNRLYKHDKEEETVNTSAEPYKDNFEYLCDQFERVTILKEIKDINESRGSRKNRDASNIKNPTEKIKELEIRIENRLNKTDKTFPFEEFKKKKNLTRKEELIVIALLGEKVVWEDSYEIDDMLGIISRTSYEKLTDRALLREDGRLFKTKIVETDSENHIFRKITIIRLNEKLKTKLLGEKKERRHKRGKFKTDGFFEMIKPSISLDKVILHPKTMEELNVAIEKTDGNTSNILQEWGIKNNLLNTTATKRRKTRQPAVMLFHGPPGTGKTLAANAIAHRLKRDLITFDCSKILSKWVGESEQNTRKIFDKYKEISSGMKNQPVLLLNEADQFLHRRINALRSVDNMYNQMQNIFLEQIERFEGILIATTNLVENLDSAFSRRFHHKIEFRRPGAIEKLKLWQVHIPEKTPLADDVDLRYLSEHYDLSGGQIALVVQNAAVRAAKRGDMIKMEDLKNACNSEITGNFDEKAKIRVGF